MNKEDSRSGKFSVKKSGTKAHYNSVIKVHPDSPHIVTDTYPHRGDTPRKQGDIKVRPKVSR